MTFFEWDENKNAANKRKHDISFELASLVFRDPLAVSELDTRFNNQEHWQTIGQVRNSWILVAHTYQETNHGEEIVRIISAREASSREKQRYQDNS